MKKQNIPTEILQNYPQLSRSLQIKNYGNGHINETFLINTEGVSFILQRVNTKVFRSDILTTNFEKFIPALEKFQQEKKTKLSPSFLKNKDGFYHSIDSHGAPWRLVEFIPGCNSYGISHETQLSYQAAQTLGRFQSFLNTLNTNEFGETIKNFHHPAGRLSTFTQVLEDSTNRLKNQAVPEIEFIQNHKSIVGEIEKLFHQNIMPRRITHNDPKLDNILFSPDNQSLVIDLDTVMPGWVIFDFGDMVRTFTSTSKEDDPQPDHVKFRPDHFEALTKGYLETLDTSLTQAEKQNLLLGAKAIIYEQALRFLTDFLNGNTYYKVDYPEHNLIRTRTQIKLLSDILVQEDRLTKIISKYSL